MAGRKNFKSALFGTDFCGEPIFVRVQQILTCRGGEERKVGVSQ
jgi:hypothetical protein